eukprot:comp20694_c0_seq1/m.42413 comp20694_c0_seq1/g.42413  ORF comp20694_c0_seq1/g.42413 comp20694_c0_seq1/m.42413 type:complete len:371 (-) comp20694_c0_seq1:1404-2516(-)
MVANLRHHILPLLDQGTLAPAFAVLREHKGRLHLPCLEILKGLADQRLALGTRVQMLDLLGRVQNRLSCIENVAENELLGREALESEKIEKVAPVVRREHVAAAELEQPTLHKTAVALQCLVELQRNRIAGFHHAVLELGRPVVDEIIKVSHVRAEGNPLLENELVEILLEIAIHLPRIRDLLHVRGKLLERLELRRHQSKIGALVHKLGSRGPQLAKLLHLLRNALDRRERLFARQRSRLGAELAPAARELAHFGVEGRNALLHRALELFLLVRHHHVKRFERVDKLLPVRERLAHVEPPAGNRAQQIVLALHGRDRGLHLGLARVEMRMVARDQGDFLGALRALGQLLEPVAHKCIDNAEIGRSGEPQ